MKYVTYVATEADIDECNLVPEISTALLEPKHLALFGRLEPDSLSTLAAYARNKGLSPVLSCDAEVPQRAFPEALDALSQISLESFDRVRVRDIGLAQFITAHHPEISLELDCEFAHHNHEAIAGWSEVFASHLSGLLLSLELPQEELKRMVQSCSVPCELLGAGPIRIFRSARMLLDSVAEREEGLDDWIEVSSSSPESSERTFPTIQNEHGTTMFLDRDHWLFDKISSLEEIGIAQLRIDLRFYGTEPERACEGVSVFTDPKKAQEWWPQRTISPFFRSNKTTAQFRRLQSKIAHLRDENCLATVVSTDGDHAVLFTNQIFCQEESYSLVLPTGEVRTVTDLSFLGPDKTELETLPADKVLVTKSLRGATTGALLRRNVLAGTR